MQLSTLICAAIFALPLSEAASSPPYCGARELSNPEVHSVTSVSGTLTVPSDLSQYEGAGFRTYVGLSCKSGFEDVMQLNLDIDIVGGVPKYRVIFDKDASDPWKRYLKTVTDMSFSPGDRVHLSLEVSRDGTEGTMTAKNLNSGQTRSATLPDNTFTCRSAAEWMFDSWTVTDFSGLEVQLDDCLYSRDGGTPIAGINSSTLYNSGCTAQRKDDDSVLLIN